MNEPEQSLRQALEEFLSAFRNLDWDPFIATFATGATVFFPMPDAPQRANGIEEISAVFSPLFESLRSRKVIGPPYLEINPLGLNISDTGTLAIVSFHLVDSIEDQAVLCRRSLVWINDGGKWRILHLHASNLPAK